MNNPNGVRRATDADIAGLLELVPQILVESEVLTLSPPKIRNLVERCCLRKAGALAGIIDGDDGAIDASIGMTFAQSEISDEPYIAIVWFGLAPHARKMSRDVKANPHGHPRAHYSRRLADFAKWAHEQMEAAAGHRIIMRWDVLTLDNLAPKLDIYGRNGLQQIGAFFALGGTGTFRPVGQTPELTEPTPAAA